MECPVYNKEGKEVGKASLPEAVFGLSWNSALVHQVVTSQAANRRQGTAHAKGRSEVRGGGKKPWKQKGTGRARHGSIRSPLWKGGGVTHGPLREKNYEKKVNKKMAKKALFTVLSRKVREGEVIVMDEFSVVPVKTKRAAEIFKNLSRNESFARVTKGNGVLVILPAENREAYRAVRNIPFASATEARNLNAYDVLQYKFIVMPKAVVESFRK
ncbi:MAG: 50S ribosomal protein L4 [Candidatus Sungbacteria bacterium RIFCSPHIGHO2_01_FULL_50_25]|uniref:Large ribosomal subunit protein uL4 n=1 Tax=Candidatus Sungbacteria bacterium RIFCSPHIGHO2_01_FULL_50_25 TaxID=1802265 RepID=A0A1G2KAH9_9BACT|nr:MAG: 50S ribosomal protein L4 [Candidatus Sungbacteria bacterium RIFCSPHIGHO2_01_FULL_50_25]